MSSSIHFPPAAPKRTWSRGGRIASHEAPNGLPGAGLGSIFVPDFLRPSRKAVHNEVAHLRHARRRRGVHHRHGAVCRSSEPDARPGPAAAAASAAEPCAGRAVAAAPAAVGPHPRPDPRPSASERVPRFPARHLPRRSRGTRGGRRPTAHAGGDGAGGDPRRRPAAHRAGAGPAAGGYGADPRPRRVGAEPCVRRGRVSSLKDPVPAAALGPRAAGLPHRVGRRARVDPHGRCGAGLHAASDA